MHLNNKPVIISPVLWGGRFSLLPPRRGGRQPPVSERRLHLHVEAPIAAAAVDAVPPRLQHPLDLQLLGGPEDGVQPGLGHLDLAAVDELDDGLEVAGVDAGGEDDDGVAARVLEEERLEER